ncbi:hypothetical protein SAMN05216551_10115 [Chitinasiproducens palmae]|uniref:Uncharacterized protein n=1 Tax=Chitinasiproducens palmae TaxID=1770053 RepID=A0A1H2PIE6_9BURK|nr:hypothetical protein SAMN05216551_10115 [Chitinasiproducens palmae]
MNDTQFPHQRIGAFSITAISDRYLAASLDLLCNIDPLDASRMQGEAGASDPSSIHINCYLARGRGRTVLIDAGAGGRKRWRPRQNRRDYQPRWDAVNVGTRSTAVGNATVSVIAGIGRQRSASLPRRRQPSATDIRSASVKPLTVPAEKPVICQEIGARKVKAMDEPS